MVLPNFVYIFYAYKDSSQIKMAKEQSPFLSKVKRGSTDLWEGGVEYSGRYMTWPPVAR